jgi:hypothetical protein
MQKIMFVICNLHCIFTDNIASRNIYGAYSMGGGDSYNIPVGKLQGKRALGRPKHIFSFY